MLAYLDANSGSLVAAAIAGGVAGIAVVVKSGWSRFVALFSPKRRRQLREQRELTAREAPVTEPASVTE